MSATLTGADLSGANLAQARLVGTNLERANINGCFVYGVSVWAVETTNAAQSNLRITPLDEPTIEVDNLEVAQFIYLLLNNQKIRQAIDSITSKVVVILGRFTSEPKSFWMQFGRRSASETTYQYYSISKSRLAKPLSRRL